MRFKLIFVDSRIEGSSNILRLILINSKFYSFVDINQLNHTQSETVQAPVFS